MKILILLAALTLSSCYVTRSDQYCQKHHKYHVIDRGVESEELIGYTLIIVPAIFILKGMIKGTLR
jgi:hypothetical protein